MKPINLSQDSNSLHKPFYFELLYIMGLSEIKQHNKKLIQRETASKRNRGSLLENAILQLDSLDKLSRLDNIEQFGETENEQLFNIALELVITWINRVLFLKLLEVQLISYHQGNQEFTFLNLAKIKNYDDLNSLFFQILARKLTERSEDIRDLFSNIPYLNSSLFEPTDLEHDTIFISNLREHQIPIFVNTVLKDSNGKKLTGNLNSLEYLFNFLDAYDFADTRINPPLTPPSKGGELDIINASVLGLIFEKINGYRDGSFFTPGFITMYMCRETIRRAIIQKFNTLKNWNCETLEQLYDHIENKIEANQIINSIRICDPAVGSGHFLVSALNEIIAIKSGLKILLDRDGKTLRDYQVTVENDELIVIDDDGNLFQYNPQSQESQRVQEALFHEKQTIIENCLFGVDINPNSVKICRLRLWIELLKNAYYKPSPPSPLPQERGERRELETLPNIDINIKCGNSLISRFPLDADLKTALKKSKYAIEDYKNAIKTYLNAENKTQKREMLKLIKSIKDSFRIILRGQDSKKTKLRNLEGELYQLENQTFLFEESQKDQKAREKTITKLNNHIDKLRAEIEDIESGKIYQNAFEWRFEFPEVLDNDGKFIGFDIVIGNPPYIFARNSNHKDLTSKHKQYFYDNYELAEYQVNLYPLFLEQSYLLLKEQGYLAYIVPNNWLTINSSKKLRQFILDTSSILIVNFGVKVFESADVDTSIIILNKSTSNPIVKLLEYKDQFKLIHETSNQFFLNQQDYIINIEAFKNIETLNLVEKIELQSIQLQTIAEVKSGLKAYEIGKGNPPQTQAMKQQRIYHSDTKIDDDYLKYLEGKDVGRYYLGWSGEYLKYGDNLAASRKNFALFSTPRILVRQIPSPLPYCINACFTEEIVLNDLNSMNIISLKQSPELILGILNSKLISFWFVHKFGKMQRGIFPQFKVNELATFPIPKEWGNYKNDLITMVKQILNLKNVDSRTDTTDLERKIDLLVYQLYRLTEAEIRMIEG